MTWTTSSAPAIIDKPLLLSQRTNDGTMGARWTNGTYGGTDVTLNTAPTRWAWDGHSAYQTYPGSGATISYLVFNPYNGFSFDTVAIINHDFGAYTTTDVRVETSNDDTWASPSLWANWTTGFNTRLTTYHNTQVWTASDATDYLRLKITTSASQTPKIGEVFFGLRHQLPWHPNVPHGRNSIDGRIDGSSSISGARSHIVRQYGRFELDATFWPSTTSEIAIFDPYDTTSWTYNTKGASEIFGYVPLPSSKPTRFYLMAPDADFKMVYDGGPIKQAVRFRAIEQGPKFCAMETHT